MKFNTVVVTGGAGFIGSHLVDALVPIAKRVVSIDGKKIRKAWKNSGAKYKTFDIRDEDLVEECLKKEKPDVVFHLAAHIHDRESVREPLMNADYNIIGSIKVFEAARKYAKKVVFSSTGIVYGEQEPPFTLDMTPMPVTPYAISKLAGERYLAFYNKVFDLPYVALRPGNIYGPRQDASAESGAIGIFASRFMKGEQVFMNNDGKTTRDYLYVDDFVNALLLSGESNITGIFNVATGIGTETQQVYELVSEAVGVQTKPESREEILDFPKFVHFDISEFVKRFGWKPETSLEDGVEKTVEWYRDNV